jgi:hypothetical protein
MPRFVVTMGREKVDVLNLAGKNGDLRAVS